VHLGILAVLSVTWRAVVTRDIYEDYALEGNMLSMTVAENALPLLLSLSLLGAGVWLFRNRTSRGLERGGPRRGRLRGRQRRRRRDAGGAGATEAGGHR